MSNGHPYLSVVATARNDDHGANLLRRMQIFVDGLAALAKRFALPMELVLVDWNPPADKPSLAEALRWPDQPGPCHFRVITVPPELHRRYAHHEQLPLFQMIAKNAGIQRARGEFVLATNIDILFSNELMEFIAARKLDPASMYRVDRHDVDSGVPPGVSIDEQLAYCAAHRIRLNALEGTFALNAEGVRKLSGVDAARPGQGIFFGPGWWPPEQHFGLVFRWAGAKVDLHFDAESRPRTLAMEIEGGPGVRFAPFRLRRDGVSPADVVVPLRARVCLRVEPGAESIRLVVPDRGPSLANGRLLNYRAFRFDWLPAEASAAPIAVRPAPFRPVARFREIAVGGARFLRDVRRRNGPIRIGLPFAAAAGKVHFRDGAGGSSMAFGPQSGMALFPPTPPADLHTNACGDFTLAHRDRWLDLRGYPEFAMYSMNIDSVFCFMAHYGGARELVLCDPMRVYHIEHASGSGWSPEGEKALYQRLAAKGIPWIPFDQVLAWAGDMARFERPLVFNREDWGLRDFDLPETGPIGRE